jgi:hypothetical protein
LRKEKQRDEEGEHTKIYAGRSNTKSRAVNTLPPKDITTQHSTFIIPSTSPYKNNVSTTQHPHSHLLLTRPTPSNTQVKPPQAITPQTITPQTITPQTITPQAITPQAITPQAITPQAITQASTPQEKHHSKYYYTSHKKRLHLYTGPLNLFRRTNSPQQLTTKNIFFFILSKKKKNKETNKPFTSSS